ncbi:MAG: hypothetical protein WA003_16710, partial [Desulfuromonadaceae bacterium]
MIRDQELAGLAMTLGRDAKIQITVSGDTSFCKPDGSHINIARMPSTPLGRMLMTGLVFHEVGHKNYTRGGKADGLLGDMMNVIEDIRVDMETIKARPGTCFNLEAVTTHYMRKGSLEPENLAQALLGKVMAYGYGHVLGHKAVLPLESLCDEMMDDAFGQEFIGEVETIIHEIPKLVSTTDTATMAKKLVDLLIQQVLPKPPPTPKQQQGHGDNNSNGSASSPKKGNGQSGQGSQVGNQQTATGTSQPATRNKMSPIDTQQQDATKASGYGGNGAGSGGGKRPSPEEIEQLLKNKSGYGDISALIRDELDKVAANTPRSARGAAPMLPVMGRLRSAHGKLDEVEAISASSRMRARLMGMLQSIKRQPKSYGLSGRKLASGRLAKLAMGDPRIFKRKVDKVAVNTAVLVLLDLSGSMSSKYVVANAAAFALHHTLFGLKGVAVCSVEFSGKDKEPEVNVLVDFGRKPSSENFNHFPFD